jgi:hypothetical protein
VAPPRRRTAAARRYRARAPAGEGEVHAVALEERAFGLEDQGLTPHLECGGEGGARLVREHPDLAPLLVGQAPERLLDLAERGLAAEDLHLRGVQLLDRGGRLESRHAAVAFGL